MQQIYDKIIQFLKFYNIEKDEFTYLVGFSGGYDSMCLLYALKKLKPSNRIVAIHLNHKWRGEESDAEEENCKAFCKKLGVEIYCENLSSKVAHTETAARDARYEFFEKCAKKYNSKIVFTAHNFNDNAETLVYRICKGTGINGLQGISENRGIFYRPLLSVSRCDIEKFCEENNLNPNRDSSNGNIKYKRNLIREKILPQMLEINSNVINSLNSLSEVAKEETAIVEEYLSEIKKNVFSSNKIQTKEFMKLSSFIQKKLVYDLFLELNLDYDRKKILQILDFIKENANSKSGKTCSLNRELLLFVSDKTIETFTVEKTKSKEVLIVDKVGCYNIENVIFEIENCDEDINEYPNDVENIAYVDLSELEFKFELRHRNFGDIIQPYGMKGSQKLKKYLNSKKIPNHTKEKLFFLAQNDEILWAPSLGISDKIKVTKTPTHKLSLKKV